MIFTFQAMMMTWKTYTVFFIIAFVLFRSILGKKLEQTESFDVKPSGQIGHQTIQLVGDSAKGVER